MDLQKIDDISQTVSQVDAVVSTLRELAKGRRDEARRHLGVRLSNAADAALKLFPCGSAESVPQTFQTLAANVDVILARDQVFIRDLYIQLEKISSDLFDQVYQEGRRTLTRMTLIKHIIATFGFKRYLEIGCCSNECFNCIEAAVKVGVDPISGGTLRMTSDDYFAAYTDEFDLIFIDGLHECTQVVRDIEHALERLAPNGYLIMHDCNPQYEVRQITPPVTGVWNGDVWKAYLHFRQHPKLVTVVGDFDYGCGVFRRGENRDPLRLDKPFRELTWDEFVINRSRWLDLKDFESLKKWIGGTAE